MKITRIVNGQEMEFELTDSELRAAAEKNLQKAQAQRRLSEKS